MNRALGVTPFAWVPKQNARCIRIVSGTWYYATVMCPIDPVLQQCSIATALDCCCSSNWFKARCHDRCTPIKPKHIYLVYPW